jgi:hypothetical protein
MPVAFIVPTGIDLGDNIVSGDETDIDETVALADGNFIDFQTNAWTENSGFTDFFAGTLPGSAISINGIIIRTRARLTGGDDDDNDLLVDHQNLGLSGGPVTFTNADTAFTNREVTLTGTMPSVATFNQTATQWRLSTNFNQVMGPDGGHWELDTLEFEVDYEEGSQNITVDQVTETDTAQPFTVLSDQNIAVDQITETNIANAFAVAAVIAITFGQVTEINTANAFTVVPGNIDIPVNQITEIDTANPFTVAPGNVDVVVAQITETDTANPFTISQGAVIAFGQPVETDTANAFTVVPGNTNIPLTQVIETNIAQPFTVAPGNVNVAFSQAVETNTAQPFTISQATIVPFSQVVETDTAQAFTVVPGNVNVAFSQIIETDTANAFTVIGGGAPVAADKLADPGTPGRERARTKPRQKHPAWREMEERLKREYETSRDVQEVTEVELEDEPPGDYLQVLIGKRDQVQDDIDAIEDRLENLEAMRSADNAIQLEIEQDIETAQHYLDLALEREITQARLIAAIEVAIMYYYY